MKRVLKEFKDFLVITLGVFLVAIGLYFFLMPHNIAAGGVNGFAMVINHYFPIFPVGSIMIILNIILFVLAFILIGPNFGGKTIYASLSLSGSILILEKVYPLKQPFTNDILLELFLGILIQGVGMAIVFNKDASTGGTDIIAKILNKYFHINLGQGVLLADITVTILASIAFGFQKGLYSLFSVIINGLIIDKMIENLNVCNEVKIISCKKDEIEEYVTKNLNRNIVLYDAKTDYSKEEVVILSTIVSSKEFVKLKRYINIVDKKAFINITKVHQTFKCISEVNK